MYSAQNNLGFGATYRTGFKNAKGTHCILVPGDNAHPAHTIIPLLEKDFQRTLLFLIL